MADKSDRSKPANTRQIGGDHYKNGGEEHWDRVARLGLDYFQGQITKYIERWRKKNGIQDLYKARHFLDKYIEITEAVLARTEKTATNPQENTYGPERLSTSSGKDGVRPATSKGPDGSGGGDGPV